VTLATSIVFSRQSCRESNLIIDPITFSDREVEALRSAAKGYYTSWCLNDSRVDGLVSMMTSGGRPVRWIEQQRLEELALYPV